MKVHGVELTPAAWRYKEYEDNFRSAWCYARHYKHCPSGHYRQPLFTPDSVKVARDAGIDLMAAEFKRVFEDLGIPHLIDNCVSNFKASVQQ